MFKYFSFTFKGIQNISSYIETAFFMSIFILIAYLYNPEDILFVEENIFPLTILLAIITLFFGIGNSFLALLIVAIVFYYTYETFPKSLFLQEVVFMLILGRFHTQWKQKISVSEGQKYIFEKKLRELGNSFYALKISHDQLERNYILRPVSMRHSLLDIANHSKSKELSFSMFLNLLSRTYNITKMSIVSIEDNVCKLESSLPGSIALSKDEPLVKRAIASSSPVYISNNLQDDSPYVAVIPALNKDIVEVLVLIEEIPFMSFSEDNMIAISFLLQFFYNTLHQKETLKRSTLLKEFNDDFRFEYRRLFEAYKSFNIDSSLIIFKTPSKLAFHLLCEHIVSQQRGLDSLGKMTNTMNENIAIVITPFSISSSAEVLKNRIISALDEDTLVKIEMSIFSISNTDIIKHYIGVEDV